MAITPFEYTDLNDLLKSIEEKADPFLLMLDSIEDPHNLGSILRTADATGVDGIIIPQRRASGLTSVVAKTSTGAIDYVPVVRVNNLVQTVDTLKDKGYWFLVQRCQVIIILIGMHVENVYWLSVMKVKAYRHCYLNKWTKH